ncbi:MAG: hypothetical protein M1832_000367 [Thelocarpon impressellum]|nr:MAG: hypothetical protein M1832_000367 [Thelocarpon impressellum]
MSKTATTIVFTAVVPPDGPFDGLLNFRDVGKTVNGLLGSSTLREGILYRSARLDDATHADRRKLVQQYGIATVVDLRTKSEHIKQAKLREKRGGWPVARGPVKMAGVAYKEINFNGGAFERALFFKLSPWNRTKLVTLMLCGYRMEAISIMGREVLQPAGLVGLGRDSLDWCGEEIRQVFSLLASPTALPTVIHCTQGKDRTGLVVLLVLLLLRVPLPAVTADYLLSETALLPERESRLAEIHEIGLTEEFADCHEDWVEEMHDHLARRYGGVAAYLARIGVGRDMQEAVKQNLLCA